MRLVIVNASGQEDDQVSSVLIEKMKPYLNNCEYGILRTNEHVDQKLLRSILKAADAFVIVTPVSFGGIPSSLLGLLSEMEFTLIRRDIPVSTVIYSDQQDLESFEHATHILKIWSGRCHVHLCMNIRISGTDQLKTDHPTGNAFIRKLNHTYQEMTDALQGNEKEDISFSTGPSFISKRRMESYWKKELSLHHLEKSDAMKQIDENSYMNK